MSDRNVAVITGGSRGIGRACAIKLAKAGNDIAVIYRGNETAAKEVVEICKEYGVDAICIQANVASSEECKAAIRNVKEQFGKVNILVNSAGITRDGLLIRMKDSDFDDVIDTNLKGTFYMMRECIPLMLKADVKRIINISSVAGVLGNSGQANYSASKSGVIGLTKSAAREYASKLININAVAPGRIETDMTGEMNEKARQAVIDTVPFKKMGDVEDIAAIVDFLSSEGSKYITGQVICVDGGMAI